MIKRIDINFKIVDEYKKAQLSWGEWGEIIINYDISGRSKQNSSKKFSFGDNLSKNFHPDRLISKFQREWLRVK